MTVTIGASEVKIIEHVPLALVQAGPRLEYVSKDPDTLTAALITRWSTGTPPFRCLSVAHRVPQPLRGITGKPVPETPPPKTCLPGTPPNGGIADQKQLEGFGG